MKKQLITLTIVSLLLAAPVLAAPDTTHNQSDLHRQNDEHGQALSTNGPEFGSKQEFEVNDSTESAELTSSPTEHPTNKPSTTPSASCDPHADWSNHGAYVSCIARLHQGGDVTSEAAHSDIGKKHQSSTPSATPTSSASATPTASPISGPINGGTNGFIFADLGKGFQHFFEVITHLFGMGYKNH